MDTGRLMDLLGARGIIDLEIIREATVNEILSSMRGRRRRHSIDVLNEAEQQIIFCRPN